MPAMSSPSNEGPVDPPSSRDNRTSKSTSRRSRVNHAEPRPRYHLEPYSPTPVNRSKLRTTYAPVRSARDFWTATVIDLR